MGSIEAIGLGVLQGLTEFLPVSSSGHLVLAHEFLGAFSGDLAFDAILHFATALAVLIYFRVDILRLAQGASSWACEQGIAQEDKTLIIALAVATAPAVVLGLFLEDVMAMFFRTPALVAGALVFGSLIMLAAERRSIKTHSHVRVPGWKSAFIIGLFQSLALVPGMSRSGMAIAGGMTTGLTRAEAARFAFLLAVPLLLGAGAKKILELLALSGEGYRLLPLLLGATAAFFVGLAVVHYLLRFLRDHSLLVFVWYRLALALFIVTFLIF